MTSLPPDACMPVVSLDGWTVVESTSRGLVFRLPDLACKYKYTPAHLDAFERRFGRLTADWHAANMPSWYTPGPVRHRGAGHYTWVLGRG